MPRGQRVGVVEQTCLLDLGDLTTELDPTGRALEVQTASLVDVAVLELGGLGADGGPVLWSRVGLHQPLQLARQIFDCALGRGCVAGGPLEYRSGLLEMLAQA